MDSNENVNELIEAMIGIFILLVILAFGITEINRAKRYDKAVTDLSMTKASSYYTLAYGDVEYYISHENVISDIQNSKACVEIQVNGITQPNTLIVNIREHNAMAVQQFANTLGGSQYKKVTIYDDKGHVRALNFEGGF